MSALLSIAKLIWPTTWLKAVLKEAETTPATVAGILFIWVTLIGLSGFAYFVYIEDAEANDARFETMQVTLKAATEEMQCAKDDRAIAAKNRAILNLTQLLELTQAPAEQRDRERELAELQRELNNLERAYAAKCL